MFTSGNTMETGRLTLCDTLSHNKHRLYGRWYARSHTETYASFTLPSMNECTLSHVHTLPQENSGTRVTAKSRYVYRWLLLRYQKICCCQWNVSNTVRYFNKSRMYKTVLQKLKHNEMIFINRFVNIRLTFC